MKKKIKELTPEDIVELDKILKKCQIITFDPKEISDAIKDAYGMREYAHDLLLQADLLLDEVLQELSGIKTNGKTTKGRKTTKSSGRANR